MDEPVKRFTTVNISRISNNSRHSALGELIHEIATFSNLVLVIPKGAGNLMGKRKPTSERASREGNKRYGEPIWLARTKRDIAKYTRSESPFSTCRADQFTRLQIRTRVGSRNRNTPSGLQRATTPTRRRHIVAAVGFLGFPVPLDQIPPKGRETTHQIMEDAWKLAF